MKVQAKHGKVTQNMHGARRNYRYVSDVSHGYFIVFWERYITSEHHETPVHLSSLLPSLLLLLSSLLLLLCYYFVVLVIGEVSKTTPVNTPLLLNILSSAFSGVVELTTQLLRLISILGSPCVESINWVTLTREDCCDSLHLWVIKTIFWRRCRGA